MSDKTIGEASAPKFERPFARALRNAISDVKGISGLILAVAGVIAAYLTLQHATQLPAPWPIIGSLIPIPLFVLFYVWPEWRDAVAQKRLTELGIKGALRSPGYFRLTPYEERDSGNYVRPDAADTNLTQWISGAASPILYVSGQSGVGKSSVLSAGVTPLLRKATPAWVVIATRPQDDALSAIKEGLLAPEVVWQRPPRGSEAISTLDLAGRAADYLFDHDRRLLIIIDQFEEALILFNDEERKQLTDFLSGHTASPREGLTVILSLRSEYIADLERFLIPPPTLGRNCFEVRPFTQASAREFIERSGLSIGDGLMNAVFEEVAEIEDMPDRVRPVVLNMIGLVLASFRGILPKGMTPGRLLSSYVRNSISAADIRSVAPKVLRPLVTSLGTKRALSLADIARDSEIEAAIARGCLIRLADSGLVRTVDKEGARWELSHDFVARLVQPIVQTWRQTAWDTARTWMAPSALIAWLLIIGGFSFLLSAWNLNYARDSLDRAGLSLAAQPQAGGIAITYNGQRVDEGTLKKATAYLSKVYSPITSLTFDGAAQLSSFEGMTIPPSLQVLSSQRTGISTLTGMPPLPNLDSLDLSSTGLQNLSNMPSLPKLANLRLTYVPLQNLIGMPVLPELTWLDLSSVTRLESVLGLPILPKLQRLSISGSPRIKSFSAMPPLPALNELTLQDMPNLSISTLPTFPSLAYLTLSRIRPTGLSDQPKLFGLHLENTSAAGMPALDIEELELSNVDFSGLPALPRLKNLILSGFGSVTFKDMPVFLALTSLHFGIIATVPSFADMPTQPKLTSIDGHNSEIVSLHGMPLLPSLATLDLSDSRRLRTLEGLPNLPKLRNLDASNSLVDSWKGIPDLPSLTQLNMAGTMLTSLADMPAFAKLQSLDVSSTPLKGIDGMPVLPSLSELKLSSSQLASFEGLPDLPHLERLDASATPLKSLDGLQSATRLKYLALGNEIENLEELPVLPQLTDLLVGGGNLSSLKGIPHLPALKRLTLTGSTRLTSLGGIEQLQTIERLDIDGTGMFGLESLPSLPNLRELSLSTEHTKSLPKWLKLNKLTLRGKSITSFHPIRDIQQSPRELLLYVDNVSEWNSIRELENLESLTVFGDAIPPMSILAQLTKLNKITLLSDTARVDLSPLASAARDLTVEVPASVGDSIRTPSNVRMTCIGGPCDRPQATRPPF